jgi:hypothetical protein
MKLIIYTSLTRIISKNQAIAPSFAIRMKGIAYILLFVFSCTITLPLAQSLFATKKVTVFVVDEEKSSSNQLIEIKEDKKEASTHLYLATHRQHSQSNSKNDSYLHILIPSAPLLEKTTPPPNFC